MQLGSLCEQAGRSFRWLNRNGCDLLVCLPFAGGASYSYVPLARALASACRVAAIDSPGHGMSPGPPLRQFCDLVQYYQHSIATNVQGQFLLYGHSLGGIAAFALAVQLGTIGRAPRKLIISGCAPPGFGHNLSWACMSDDEFLRHVRRLGGVDPRLLEHDDFCSHLHELLKADAELHVSASISSAVDMPVFVIVGDSDPVLDVASARLWTTYARECQVLIVEGGIWT